MAASLLGLGLFVASAPTYAQSRLDQGGPSLVPESASSSPGVTLTFHKTPTAQPASEQTFHFRKEASRLPVSPAWKATSSFSPRRLPDSLLALQAKDPIPRAPKGGSEESLQYQIPLELPGQQALLGKLDTEEELKERMRQEARNQNPDNRVVFPDEPVVSKENYTGRSFPPAVEVAEPYYVCHGRLYFEEINSERYGWDLGAIQPMVSAGNFYLNLATLPYHMFTRPCDRQECSAGYCLPGDPVPYLLYPPEISLTGTAAEGAALAVLLAIFP